jgi:hypothetical protein
MTWTIKQKTNSEATIWDGDLFIASVATSGRDKTPNLIAASPKLLNACKKALMELDNHKFTGEWGDYNDDDVFAVCAILEKAIALAEGGTHEAGN